MYLQLRKRSASLPPGLSSANLPGPFWRVKQDEDEISNYDGDPGEREELCGCGKAARLTSLTAIARETAAALENVSGSNLNRTMLLPHKLLSRLQHKGQLAQMLV